MVEALMHAAQSPNPDLRPYLAWQGLPVSEGPSPVLSVAARILEVGSVPRF
jgi:hypothetical protein